MKNDVTVAANEDEMIAKAISIWQRCYQSAIQERGQFVVALSGGESPKNFLKALSLFTDTNRLHVFLVDERFVPITHEDSNYRMIKELFLDPIGLPEANRHYVKFSDSVETSAKLYEDDLKDFFNNELPVFDLILLGMGSDGHTASLFPKSAALAETVRWVMPVKDAPIPHDRITLTLPVINHARQIVFYVKGTSSVPYSLTSFIARP